VKRQVIRLHSQPSQHRTDGYHRVKRKRARPLSSTCHATRIDVDGDIGHRMISAAPTNRLTSAAALKCRRLKRVRSTTGQRTRRSMSTKATSKRMAKASAIGLFWGAGVLGALGRAWSPAAPIQAEAVRAPPAGGAPSPVDALASAATPGNEHPGRDKATRSPGARSNKRVLLQPKCSTIRAP